MVCFLSTHLLHRLDGKEPSFVFLLSKQHEVVNKACHLKFEKGNFPGIPVVKILPPNARGAGLIRSQRAKSPNASGPKKKTKQRQYSINTLKIIHIKK